ncbi:MAG: hypothetical protein RIF37_02155 [Rhodospirillaceae bacterium]
MRDSVLAALAVTLCGIIFFSSSAGPPAKVASQEKNKVNGNGNPTVLIDRNQDGRVDMDVEVPISVTVFSQGERNAIADCYRDASPTARGLPPRDVHSREIVDDDVLLMAIATGVVADSIENVIS